MSSLTAVRRELSLLVLGFMMIVLAASARPLMADASGAQNEITALVTDLISKLGADDFATRLFAQGELQRIGLLAFDALQDAQDHDDLEIAMRARYLLRSLHVEWAQEDDSPDVKKILRGYENESDENRRSRMSRLANLDESAGVPALCRLVRFETSWRLSKQAALLVMNHSAPSGQIDRQALAATIRANVGGSKRPGARWLRAYSQTLQDADGSFDQWQELAETEQATFTRYPEQSNEEIVRDLYRWFAEQLADAGHDERAVDVMRKTIALLDGSSEQILDMVDWLMKRDAWVVIDEVADRYSSRFNQNEFLLYRLAESKRQQGENELAEKLANKALQLVPAEPERHIVLALSLQERGMLVWAEKEYRYVLELDNVGSPRDFEARILLSEMLHDLGNDLSAAEVLQVAVEKLENDPAALDKLRGRIVRDLPSVKSRMLYFFSRHHLAAGQHEQHRKRLKDAIKSDPTDADVLIAMHRTENADAEWIESTREQIEAATGKFRDQIATYRRLVAESANEADRAWANRELAVAHNQFAWLVGNTVGDYDEAIRSSKRSLELRPEVGGYLDTLGRCYFAKGDLINAVKYQQRAAELEPHSYQIRRQLEEFKQALAESGSGTTTRQTGETPAKDQPDHNNGKPASREATNGKSAGNKPTGSQAAES